MLFSDIEVILRMNTLLLDKLSERMNNWSNIQKIGDIFVGMTESFKLYTQYVNNFEVILPSYGSYIKITLVIAIVGRIRRIEEKSSL
jgi:hypothetical protein